MSLATIASALDYFDVSRDEFFSKSRFTRPVTTRQAVAYVMHKRDGVSLPMIGQRLNRDHSTIKHAVDKTEHKLIPEDDEVRIWIDSQMALPKHHQEPVYVENPYRPNMGESGRKPPQKAEDVAPSIVIPNFQLIEKTPEQAEPHGFHLDETAIVGDHVLHMNKDGNCREDHLSLIRIERASLKLAKVIKREHPERFVA